MAKDDHATEGRDVAYEAAFLDEVVNEAARRAGVDASAYAETVRARLELGAQRYGESFRTDERDMLREVCEETPDVCGYSLLELQKLNGTASAAVHQHLFEASVHAAIADAHARAARIARAHS